MKSKCAPPDTKQQASQQATDPSWPMRLRTVLVGACILFSLFFAFDFVVAKLSNWLAAAHQPNHQLHHRPTIAGHSEAPAARRLNDVNWSPVARTDQCFVRVGAASEASNTTDAPVALPPAAHQQLLVDFGLIYERQLPVSRDRRHFVRSGRNYEIRADLKLRRLLTAYHVAMPFDPDIWLLSEPTRELHLLRGNLTRCSADLDALLHRVGSVGAAGAAWTRPGAQHLRLMQLLDAFGRPEAGTLLGHPFWLGSYAQCTALASAASAASVAAAAASHSLGPLRLRGRPLATRYCVGKLALASWGPPEVGFERAPPASIKLGLCLPATCDSAALLLNDPHHVAQLGPQLEPQVRRMLELAKRLALTNFNARLFAEDQLNLTDIYCLPPEDGRRLGVAGSALVALVVGWCALCVACTWLRQRRAAADAWTSRVRAAVGERTLEALAIDANLRHLVAGAAPQQRQVDLDVLDCVKHLGCACVIGAHVFLAHLTLGTGYEHTVDTIGSDLRTMLVLSLNNVVDTFFVISGLLVAYLTLGRLAADAPRKAAHFRWAEYLALVGQRYVRMAPLYWLVYAWSKCVSVRVGAGPLWDYGTSAHSLRGLCARESWLWALLFASDLKPMAEHCIPAAWSVAADLHFFLVVPALIALLRRAPRAGYALLGALIVASTAHTLSDYGALLRYVSADDFAKLGLHVFTLLIRYAAHAYSQPQNRIAPMLIGLLGGHLLAERRAILGPRHPPRPQAERRTQVEPAHDSPRLPGPQEAPAGRLWPRWMCGGAFAGWLAGGAALMLGPLVVQVRERTRPGPAGSAHFDCYLALAGFVLIKPAWSACNCVALVRLATDLRRSVAGRVAGMRVWRPLARLNYAMLLVHFELIAFECMSRTSLSPVTWPHLLSAFAFAYLGSVLAAGALYVLLERPVQQLARHSNNKVQCGMRMRR